MEKNKRVEKIITLRQDEELLILIRAYCREQGYMFNGQPNMNQFFRVMSVNMLIREGRIDWRSGRRLRKDKKKK